jgi:hypothetical protein
MRLRDLFSRFLLTFGCLSLIGLMSPVMVQSVYASSETDVLAIVKTLTDGWKEADSGKMESALHPNFRLVTLRESPAETQIDTREHLIETVKRIKPGTWDDRLRDQEVRVDPSGIATVWAKYEFYVNGERTHCGIVSMQLYRVAESWKIINFADTHSARFCQK